MTQSRPLPRSIQISETLIREIASGLLPDGARLPTEREMAVEYDVAVGTLRKALAILEGKNLLERVQGSGNYVRKQGRVASIYSQFHLELTGGGGLPTATILGLRKDKSPKAAKTFGFADQSFRIDRLRCLNNIPIAVERIWLNGIYTLPSKSSEISESLYEFYRDELGLIISRAEDSIGVSEFPGWSPTSHFKTGLTAGYIARRAWSQSSEPAEYSETWFDPNKARYINRLEGQDMTRDTA